VTEPASRSTRPASARPRFTGRAAILAVVLCAIALSLAYPIREYIAQRRQIDQLQAQRRQIAMHLKELRQQQKRLHDPKYIERQARDRLHMCFPNQKCYVIIEPAPKNTRAVTAQADGVPWYARLWKSVQQANQQTKAGQGRNQSQGAGPLGMATSPCMEATSIAPRGDGCPIYTAARAGAGRLVRVA
jgi:cell division protein FtsB